MQVINGAKLTVLLVACLLLVQVPFALGEAGGPVAKYPVTGAGDISTVYKIAVLNVSTGQPISMLPFLAASGPGTHIEYVNLNASAENSGPLSIKYSVSWTNEPPGLQLTLNFLSEGTFIDLNQSGLVLSPGQNTDGFPHPGYPSPVQAELQVPNGVHGNYNFTLTVFGFLESNSTETSQTTLSSTSQTTLSSTSQTTLSSTSQTTPSSTAPLNGASSQKVGPAATAIPESLLAIPAGMAALVIGAVAIRRVRARRSTFSPDRS